MAVTCPVVWEGCTPFPAHPGSQQARIATFGGNPTGLFRGFLREVSREIVYQARFAYPKVLRAKKPACLEFVSFEDRWLPQA